LIYLCRSKYYEAELQDEVDSIVRSKFQNHVFPIIINIFDHISGTEKIMFDKRWDQSKRYEYDKATAKKAARTRKRRRRKRK